LYIIYTHTHTNERTNEECINGFVQSINFGTLTLIPKQ